MGAASKISSDEMEAPRSTSPSDIPYSGLTVQTSLSLPEMTPRVMLVIYIHSNPFQSVPCRGASFLDFGELGFDLD